MALQGKGIYIWKIEDCEGGNVNAIANLAEQANFTHVLVKVSDGVKAYDNNEPKAGALFTALRNKGIAPWGWQYVYGYNPVGEANVAVRQVKKYELDGFVINAESQYKEAGKKESATRYMSILRPGLSDIPLGLSSYRFPSYHPQLPWREFLSKCDLNMPQVYWMGAHDSALQLRRTIREFKGMTPMRKIVPTGAAFKEHGWEPTPEEIIAFLDEAKIQNLDAANMWEWSDARRNGFWDTVADYQWGPQTTPEKDLSEKYIDALNTRSVEKVVEQYVPSAVHVTSSQTIQGLSQIRAWYQHLFADVLPQGQFTLTGYSGSGNVRHLTWTATSQVGSVLNGNDTLGISNGKISYHYSFFQLS